MGVRPVASGDSSLAFVSFVFFVPFVVKGVSFRGFQLSIHTTPYWTAVTLPLMEA
jgi:hypothetical protein